MLGDSRERPGWVDILQAAQEWSIPPWQVEAECTQLWWERRRALQEIEAEVREYKRQQKAGQGT